MAVVPASAETDFPQCADLVRPDQSFLCLERLVQGAALIDDIA